MAYNASITFWKVNGTNTAIATTNDGAGNPTEQIASPVNGGPPATATAVNSGVNVTGTNTTFSTSFSPGQYLYYVDNVGNYILVGQIDTITSNTALVLKSPVVNNIPPPGKLVAASSNLITLNESFYIRVSTVVTNQGLAMPNFNGSGSGWRTTNSSTATNNPSRIALDTVSNIGNPLSTAGTTTPIPFTMQLMNTFTLSTQFQTYCFSAATAPEYIWLLAKPYTISGLSSQTMYRLTAEESTPSISTGFTISGLNFPGFTKGELAASGYFF
jgi:hypothetical protein